MYIHCGHVKFKKTFSERKGLNARQIRGSRWTKYNEIFLNRTLCNSIFNNLQLALLVVIFIIFQALFFLLRSRWGINILSHERACHIRVLSHVFGSEQRAMLEVGWVGLTLTSKEIDGPIMKERISVCLVPLIHKYSLPFSLNN